MKQKRGRQTERNMISGKKGEREKKKWRKERKKNKQEMKKRAKQQN